MQNASEKEEFRNYLDKSGVIDALTKVLVTLYEEKDKPEAALDYVKKHLGSVMGVDVDGLKQENEALKKEIAELKEKYGIQDEPMKDATPEEAS